MHSFLQHNVIEERSFAGRDTNCVTDVRYIGVRTKNSWQMPHVCTGWLLQGRHHVGEGTACKLMLKARLFRVRVAALQQRVVKISSESCITGGLRRTATCFKLRPALKIRIALDRT